MISNKLDIRKDSISIGDEFTIYSDPMSSFLLKYPIHSDRMYLGFCLDGYAEMEVNLIKHMIKKNEIIIIYPNQIVFHYKISDDFRLVMISFSKDLLNEMSNSLRKYPPHFIFRQQFPSIVLDDMEMSQIMELFNLIRTQTESVKNDCRIDIIKHLLCSLMINIYWYGNRNSKKTDPISQKQEMIGAFFALIFEHFKEAKDVSFYADKLCVSPKYLSSLLKKNANKTPKECIDHYVILEIKVLLNSTFTIQEISQQLNFPNQSFFGKYFKKHTGMSPYNYRKSIHE